MSAKFDSKKVKGAYGNRYSRKCESAGATEIIGTWPIGSVDSQEAFLNGHSANSDILTSRRSYRSNKEKE
jgi:hypothetical protein